MSASFEKKLAELDAYLQMLIAENDSLDKKLSEITSSSSSSLQSIAAQDSERDGLLSIKNNLETLISSIKYAIVLLQIAKVSAKGTVSSSDFHHSSSSKPPTAAAAAAASRNSPSTPSPPTRPIRSSKDTGGSVNQTQGSWGNGSSSCDSYNSEANKGASQGEEKSIVAQHSNRSSSSDLPSVYPQPEQVAASSARREQQEHKLEQRDGLAQRYQAPADPSSSSSKASEAAPTAAARAKASENRHNSSQKNAATVNLGDDTTARGIDGRDSGGSGSAAGKIIQAKSNANDLAADADPRGHDAGVVEEDEDDAFFDAADEQLPKLASCSESERNQPISHDDNDKSTNSTRAPQQQQVDIENLNATPASTPALQNSSSNMSPRGTGQIGSNNPNETNNNDDKTIEDGSIDWDLMYEEEEEELDSMEGQGSVIKHLLSQIRIGMDLTKVVLPTFILERRSLLEMYADFFAHPDLFSAIPDFTTPEERMVQLVKWYLSAFHAGRRSAVAKKPYNPILGEIFRCKWNLLASGAQKTGDVSIGAQERSSADEEGQELTFVAEQVSHHPPVSAFYAENKEKDISCCAHIYTKSKYLGLSVGVHNLGQGVISVRKHGETYVCTFPSAYGRSILTVPWVELGGSVNISCEQTGYKANIEFVTKPFYGGKKHRVTGEILRPNGEPFLAIEGEWNGVMFSRSPPNSSRKEVFVDTTRLPVIKKHVKSISAQETFESRNVWKAVTRALKLRDLEIATAAKNYIEQRQRDLLKERQEKGAKWKTRFFEPASGDSWRYSGP